jgi:hypothetical protein
LPSKGNNQVIRADSEDNFQRGVFTLQNIAKNFEMEISPGKSETVAFLLQQPVSCKTVVDNNCLQQVRNFKYLNCEISYENENDIQQKLSKFAQILRILNNASKPILVPKFSRIKVCNALVLPILLHGSEIWTLTKEYKND